MGSANNPNNFGSSVLVINFFSALLYLSIIAHLSDAQNIVSFPTARTISPTDSSNIVDEQEYTLSMTGASTTRDNQTICTGFTLPSSPTEFWIIGFEGKASVSVTHHMTLYGCASVPSKACGCGMASRSPLYSWVRNTPKVRYTGTGTSTATKGGFRIGGSSDKQFLFLEIHYCHAGTTNDQSGITIRTTTTNSNIHDLAIFPIMGLGTIPSSQASYKMDTCLTSLPSVFNGDLVYFGFQVHTHNLGRLVSAYFLSADSTIFDIGQGNPLWPEAYVEIPHDTQLNPDDSTGDTFITRCVYDSSGTTSNTNTNGPISPSTPWHEMCIFNLLVYHLTAGTQFSTKNAFLKGTCSSSSDLDSKSSSTTLLTAIPALETAAAATGSVAPGTYTYGTTNQYQINMKGETFSNTFFEEVALDDYDDEEVTNLDDDEEDTNQDDDEVEDDNLATYF